MFFFQKKCLSKKSTVNISFVSAIKIFIKKIIKKIYLLKTKRNLRKTKPFNVKKCTDVLNNAWTNHNISCLTNRILRENKYDLSIIIPLYNSHNFIDKCLGSVLNQNTQYDYEVILVNDGSTDNTLELVTTYANKYNNDKIKIITQENSGISVARNSGIDIAQGKYIGFIDHDDFVSDFYVESLLSLAFSNNADIVKCGIAVTSNNKVLNKFIQNDIVINGPMNDNLFLYKSFIWASIFKRDLFCDINFPPGCWYEDMIGRTLLWRKAKVFVNDSDILYFKQQHNNNSADKVWSNANPKCLEQLYLIEGIVKDNKCLGLDEDFYFYWCVLLECSGTMVKRIKGLDNNTKKQIFIRVNELLKSIYKSEYEKLLPKDWKIMNDIILKMDFNSWLSEEYLL